MSEEQTVETPTSSEAPAPVAESPVEVGNGEDAKWWSGLPEDLQDKFSRFETEEDLARSYSNLESKLGKDTLPLPETDEDREKIHIAMGRPDSSEAYEVERPEMPEGMEYDQEAEDFWRGWAFDHGMSQKDFADMYAIGTKQRVDQFTQVSAMNQEYTRKLDEAVKKEFGSALPEYRNGAKAVMGKYADEDFNHLLDTTDVGGFKLGDHPAFVKAMGKIGRAMMGEADIKGKGEMETPADIAAQIADHRSKHEKALMDRDHPEHKLRVSQLTGLYDKHG